MVPIDTPSRSTFRYGDFPFLFWDAQPDALIDVSNPVVLARLLTRGRADVIGKLVSLEVLRERLISLTLPEHVQVFWRTVFEVTQVVAPDPDSPSE